MNKARRMIVMISYSFKKLSKSTFKTIYRVLMWSRLVYWKFVNVKTLSRRCPDVFVIFGTHRVFCVGIWHAYWPTLFILRWEAWVAGSTLNDNFFDNFFKKRLEDTLVDICPHLQRMSANLHNEPLFPSIQFKPKFHLMPFFPSFLKAYHLSF